MTIICPMCCGRSRVAETRLKPSRVVARGTRKRSTTYVRLRQCLQPKCRFRWRTVEVPYSALLNRRGAFSANSL